MFESPDQQWRELTAHYAEMWDEELLNLAADYNDLTDMAKQVLRDEMKKRGLDVDRPPSSNIDGSSRVARKNFDLLAGPMANSYIVQDDDANAGGSADEPDSANKEYTWKARLCECDDVLQARQVSAALDRAGIENWIEAMPSYAIGVFSPRVFVAADRLEDAQGVLARPISQDIIDESKMEVPEYAMPRCPRCSGEEPTLVSAVPSNTWHCESCGNEWTDPVTEPNPA